MIHPSNPDPRRETVPFGAVYETGQPPIVCRHRNEPGDHTLVERAGFVLCTTCDDVALMGPAPEPA